MNKTYLYIFSGFTFALLLVIPSISNQYGYGWAIGRIPYAAPSLGLHYIDIFFHEIGHTLTSWFYGHPALPSFDFQHGGGMTYNFNQNFLIFFSVTAVIIYAAYYFREYKIFMNFFIALALFQIMTGFTVFSGILLSFMGHGFSIMIGSFFIYRAAFNLAPRGGTERFLNSAIGFGLILNNMVLLYGLLRNPHIQQSYLKQKGSHGFGDFNKISDAIPFVSFDYVILFTLFFAFLFLFLPLIYYFLSDNYYLDKYSKKPKTH